MELSNVVEDSYLHEMNYRQFQSVIEIVHTMRLLALMFIVQLTCPLKDNDVTMR